MTRTLPPVSSESPPIAPAESESNPTPQPQKITDIAEYLGLLFDPGEVFEVRSPDCPQKSGSKYRRTYSGYFNDLSIAAKWIKHIDQCGPAGCYITLNPASSHLLARATNAAEHGAKHTTSDTDIVRRKWLLVDIDSARPAGMSATDNEGMNAVSVAKTIRVSLSAEGFPDPIRMISGNGCYLVFKIDLPNDDSSTKLARDFLHAIHERFSTKDAHVDLATFNASRIAKPAGTHARKGSNFIDASDPRDNRPHRLAYAVRPSGPIETVSRELLEQVASTASTRQPKPPQPARSPSLDSALLKRARNYVANMPPAIAGQGGHNQTLKVAATGARFGIDADSFRSILDEFNARCVPPWTAAELEHKLKDGYRLVDADGSFGRLVNDAPEKRSTTGSDAPAASQRTKVTNYEIEIQEEENSKGESVEKRVKIGLPISVVAADLLRIKKGWPRAIGGMPFVSESEGCVTIFSKPSHLFGWINSQSTSTWGCGEDFPTKEEFFSGCVRHLEQFDAVEITPHFPAIPKHYYATETPAAGDGSRLDEFLKYFSFSSPTDRELAKALIMTLFWGGPYGSRPGAVITSPDGTGAGKTTFAQKLAALAGGAIELSKQSTDERLRTSLLTPDQRDKRIVVVDNMKGRLSSETIESLITSPIIAGHQLHHGFASRPNTLLWIIAANDVALSRDLSERCVTIHLEKPKQDGGWLAKVDHFIARHRRDIIGDVRAFFETTPKKLEKFSRWSTWESAILARFDDPVAMQKMISNRQKETDSDSDDAIAIADYFRERLRFAGYDPNKAVVHIPSRLAATWIADAVGEKLTSHAATATEVEHREGE